MNERAEIGRWLIDVLDDYVPPSKRGQVQNAISRLVVGDVDTPGPGYCKACGVKLPPYQGRGRPRSYCDEHAPKKRLGEKTEKWRVTPNATRPTHSHRDRQSRRVEPERLSSARRAS